MSEQASQINTSTRGLLYFDDNPGNWAGVYGLILLVGLAIFVGLIFSINEDLNNKKPPDFNAANSATWYLVINGLVAFLIYGFTRRQLKRTIRIGFVRNDPNKLKGAFWTLFLLTLSPAFLFVEIFDKIYVVFRKVFKGDQEEIDTGKADSFINDLKNSRFGSFFRTVDLNNSEMFTYLFGTLSYDREDAYKMFVDGTDIVRTPVMICSFFVALCFTIPVIISAANKESIEEKWIENIAPVTTVISGLVIIFILGTLQGYGDSVTSRRSKMYKEDNNAAGFVTKGTISNPKDKNPKDKNPEGKKPESKKPEGEQPEGEQPEGE